MMNNSMKNLCSIRIGSSITGKWHRNVYHIRKELGRGANGVVYLADSNQGKVAVKISDSTATIAGEVNVLKSLAKVRGMTLGPSLLDVDDVVTIHETLPFYVMEFIEGDNLYVFCERKGADWLGVIALQLLQNLDELHSLGWTFGDLKPENLIIQTPHHKLRFIDVGGTTQVGRAIKEYTEYFDRGYWGLGGRRAEPSYDLFAATMILIQLAYRKKFTKSGDSQRQLETLISGHPALREIKPVLVKALTGKYESASQMRHELKGELFKKKQMNQSVKSTNHPVNRQRHQPKSFSHGPRQRRGVQIFETVFLIFLVTLLYMMYMFGQFLS